MSLEKLNKVEVSRGAHIYASGCNTDIQRNSSALTISKHKLSASEIASCSTKPAKDAGPNPTKAERERRVDVMQEQLTQLIQVVVSIAKHQAISPPSSSPTVSQTKAGITKDK
jgi:hypothetical protein